MGKPDTKERKVRMKTKTKSALAGAGFLAAFAVWTAAVRMVDVQPIGPLGSAVGFATVNSFVHRLTGVYMGLYTLTDWLGLVPLGVALGFGILGLCQWVNRKHILKVDRSILVLGIFYIAVMAAFLFFEGWVVNYRPVLMDGGPEASYPSSTTLLTLTVMPTAGLQLRSRTRNKWLLTGITAFTAFMVIARLLSGVHWFTDIVGGILLSAGLVSLYRAAET